MCEAFSTFNVIGLVNLKCVIYLLHREININFHDDADMGIINSLSPGSCIKIF